MKGTEPARVGRATRPWGVVLFVQAANAALVVFLLIVLVGEQGRRLPDAWLAWVAVALSAWLLLRSFVVSVRVEGAHVVVRSWWRTTRLEASSVTVVSHDGYIGLLVRTNVRGWLRMLTITTDDGRRRAFPAICGTAGRLDRLTWSLSRALGR